MGMKHKISLVMALVVVVPLVALGIIARRSQEALVSRNIQAVNRGVTILIAHQVYGLISSSRSLVNTLLLSGQFRSFDRKAMETVVREFLDRYDRFSGISVYDFDRKCVLSVGKPLEPRDRERLFSRAVFDQYGAEVDNRRHEIVLYGLVVKEDGTLGGVLVAGLKKELFSKTLNSILERLSSVYEDLDIFLLDEDSWLIATTCKHLQASSNPRQVMKYLWRRGRTYEYEINTFRSYGTPPWRVVVVAKEAVMRSLEKMITKMGQIMAAAILLAVLIGWIFASRITGPLSALVRSANAIAKGDLSRSVEVTGDDEIGELAESFELMRQNLRKFQASLEERVAELETLYNVGRAVSSTLDFRRLMEIILDQVLKIMNAERGSIMLLDEKTQELRIEIARGLPEDVIRTTRVKVGEKISGYVLETGRPLLIIDTTRSPSFSRLKDGKIAAGTLLSVPLVAKDKRLGVLNVSKSIPYSFDDRDLDLLSALSNQVAIAIDNARLYTLAITDELTGIYIRRYFMQRLKEELRRGKRYAHDVTVMMLDIDHFKNFNDTYGHQQGDVVLRFVAATLKRTVRTVDIVARLGGEEFAVICPQKDAEEALVPAERIRRAVEEARVDIGVAEVNVTVSIGVASAPGDAASDRDLLEAADKALYEAKARGRNRVCLYRRIRGGDEGKESG